MAFHAGVEVQFVDNHGVMYSSGSRQVHARIISLLGWGAVVAGVAGATLAQPLTAYPVRPIRLIVPSAPGGSPDISSRLLAPEITRQMGQQLVVDNRSGAGGVIGYEMVAKAPADGYTLGYATFALSTVPALTPNLRYDAMRDLQMVMHLTSTPNVMAVFPGLPVKSVEDLLAHARKNPGALHYVSSGVGTSLHLAGALLMSMSGVQLTHVPYKGVDQAVVAVIGNESQLIMHNSAPMIPHVRAGRVRGIAVTVPRRLTALPDLPTVSEAGVPGYEIAPWGGIMAPSGIPKPILARLNAEFNIALKSKPLQDAYTATSVLPMGGSPEQFTDFLRKETEKWGALIKRLAIKV
jgi:tripartite-type tricarboxylate transporter receptor subunit TctC